MTGRHPSWVAAGAAALALLLSIVLGASIASAAPRDRTPPTTPTNLRVTGMTAYSVSLAWSPSTDNSGSVTYTICCANVSSETFPGPASSRTYRAGLEANRSFTLRIIAKDAAGNYSGYSNSVTFTLPSDTIPPTKPAVSLTDVGPTHVSLAWSSTEDGPNVWFSVFMNGNRIIYGSRDTSATIGLLEPETTYTFTVQAQDFGNNQSPLSDPITVKTEPSNPNDVTPPTTPTNLSEMHWGDGEIHVSWTQSTDDFDEQRFIRYNVYVNDVLSDTPVGSGFSIVYNTNPGGGGLVRVTIIAVDTAGNQSAPASITINMDLP
jgi:chitodextrinase